MAIALRNIGFDFLCDNDDLLKKFVATNLSESKSIPNYYGGQYLYHYIGVPETWASVMPDEEGNINLIDFHTHCSNTCIWNVEYTGIDLSKNEKPKLQRTLMFREAKTGNGMVPINIITSDVIPCYSEGDKYDIQVAAFPMTINYYKDEDEYAEAQPKDDNGEAYLIGEGTFFPTAFLINHNPETYDNNKEYEDDSFVEFHAKVKGFSKGIVEFGEEKESLYIQCLAETQFGEIVFSHTFEDVPEEQRENMKAGAIISGTCIISGDVAIREYENGIVRDFKHNLQLVRHTAENGEAERLKSVLAEDCVYTSQASGKTCVGINEIIERFNYVNEAKDYKISANNASIISVDDETLPYPVGTECLVIYNETEGRNESILFLQQNEDNMISKIEISTNGNYHFEIKSEQEAEE